jgi:hypothetical protein
MTLRKTAATLTATIALATGGFLTAGAEATDGGGPNNVVMAQTTGGNDVQERSGLQVGSYGGDDLKSANIARADSHDCTDCRTVAVALQAVFATGHPSTVEPANVALATNEQCLRCTTYAYAYQYVLTTDGPVHLSRGAAHKIAEIRHEVSDVAHSDAAPPDLDAQLNTLAGEFKSTIDDDLARAGTHERGEVHKHESEGDGQQ